MALNLNKVILAGRLVADPEMKQTQSGLSVASFRIAVNRRYTQGQNPEADFFSITAWRKTAEFVGKYFHKGMAIFVAGSIQNRDWTDAEGKKHYATDIVADEVNFVEGKGADQQPAAPATPYDNVQKPAPKFEEIKTDEDLPF